MAKGRETWAMAPGSSGLSCCSRLPSASFVPFLRHVKVIRIPGCEIAVQFFLKCFRYCAGNWKKISAGEILCDCTDKRTRILQCNGGDPIQCVLFCVHPVAVPIISESGNACHCKGIGITRPDLPFVFAGETMFLTDVAQCVNSLVSRRHAEDIDAALLPCQV